MKSCVFSRYLSIKFQFETSKAKIIYFNFALTNIPIMKEKILTTFPTVILGLFLCQSCRETAVKEVPAVPVTTMTASTVTDGFRRFYTGDVNPARNTLITAPYPGTVTSVHVHKGQSVKEGQVIATVRSQTVESAYEISQATLKQAEDGYARVKKVYDTGTVSEVQMMDIETQLAKARAAAASSQESMEKCTIRAPYSGVISDIDVESGVDVMVGAPMARLMDMSRSVIEISVPENDVRNISEGMKALVDITSLNLSGLPATVVARHLAASDISHSYSFTLELDRSVEQVMPGMVAKVSFSRQGETGIVIPAKAVLIDRNGRYVWVNENGTAQRREVTVNGYSGKGVIVTDGLKNGDRVIVSGFQKVSTGMKVTER